MAPNNMDLTELAEIVNELAGKVVLIDGDDIQALGEVLQIVNKLTHPSLAEFADELRAILESIILDEYESVDEGMGTLNEGVQKLQNAFDRMGMVDADDLASKQAMVDEDSPSSPKKSKAVPKQSTKKAEPKAEPKKPKAVQESRSEPQPAATEIPEAPPETTLAISDDDDGEDDTVYFEHRDDPKIIQQTITEDPELVQGFIEESIEQLTMIENGLISWEEAPDDLTIIDSIFRPFHTIKGVSGFLNLSDINSFAHIYEDLLDDARKGRVVYNEQIAEAVFEGIDALRRMIDAVASSLSQKKYVKHDVDVIHFAQLISNARSGKQISSSKKTQTQEVKSSAAQDAPKSEEAAVPGTSSAARDLNRSGRSVKVNTSKMDNLIDLVGELVVTQNMVVQNPAIQESSDKRLIRDIGQLKRITSNLQDLSMSLRMVPIKDTFQRMHRIVRDIARKSGKKIVLETFGEDTELDRNMVEELYEPLVHMIRNNCDHGIESPEIRKKLGKPETGALRLSAYYKGGMVIIEVADDGKGIDKEVIWKSAIKKGLIKEDEKPSEAEILNFIFSSGFSTSQQVTDISGRGVGMDVVKKAITKLRGSIEVKTKVNKGTTFSLRLPLTLAIIDGVIVRVGQERYIIPTLSIKESMMASSGSFNKIVGKGETIFIRGRIIPLLRLGRVFDIPEAIDDPNKGLLIVVESDGQEAALLVDGMLDKQEIVIKTLGDGLNKVDGIAGGAIMSDGNVGLIVDIPTLLPKNNKMRINTIND